MFTPLPPASRRTLSTDESDSDSESDVLRDEDHSEGPADGHQQAHLLSRSGGNRRTLRRDDVDASLRLDGPTYGWVNESDTDVDESTDTDADFESVDAAGDTFADEDIATDGDIDAEGGIEFTDTEGDIELTDADADADIDEDGAAANSDSDWDSDDSIDTDEDNLKPTDAGEDDDQHAVVDRDNENADVEAVSCRRSGDLQYESTDKPAAGVDDSEDASDSGSDAFIADELPDSYYLPDAERRRVPLHRIQEYSTTSRVGHAIVSHRVDQDDADSSASCEGDRNADKSSHDSTCFHSEHSDWSGDLAHGGRTTRKARQDDSASEFDESESLTGDDADIVDLTRNRDATHSGSVL